MSINILNQIYPLTWKLLIIAAGYGKLKSVVIYMENRRFSIFVIYDQIQQIWNGKKAHLIDICDGASVAHDIGLILICIQLDGRMEYVGVIIYKIS